MSDLATLMERDPLSLTTDDIDQVIKDMRAKRHLFNLGDTKAGTVKTKTPKALAGAAKDELAELFGDGLKI